MNRRSALQAAAASAEGALGVSSVDSVGQRADYIGNHTLAGVAAVEAMGRKVVEIAGAAHGIATGAARVEADAGLPVPGRAGRVTR